MNTPNSTVSDVEVEFILAKATGITNGERQMIRNALRALSTGTDAGVREVWRSENHDALLAHATPVERMQRICDSKSFNYSEIFGMAGAWYAAYSALEQQPAASQEGARNEAARMQEQGHDPRVPLTGKGA